MEIPVRTLDEVLAVCTFLKSFPAPWWIGGGWAIDMWAGGPTRDHEDIEICVAREYQDMIFQRYADWQFFKPSPTFFEPMAQGERLQPPVFILRLEQTAHTIADAAMPPTFEFLLNDIEGDHLLFPHDHSISIPFERVRTMSPYGVPVAAPEIVLAIKSWYPRPKDQHDFERVLPQLDDERRDWLRGFLQRTHPDMLWLAALDVG